MTAPTRHLPEDLLVSYANGASPEAHSLLVATHLTMCPTCRTTLSTLEQTAGQMLERQQAIAPSDSLLDQTLARLESSKEDIESPTPSSDHLDLPGPIRAILGETALTWRTYMPGARHIQLPVQLDGVPAQLFEFGAGTHVPKHSHEGRELTVVLKGGYTDGAGEHLPGDVGEQEARAEHGLAIHGGEPCIALVVNDGLIAPRGPFAPLLRLVAHLTGRARGLIR